MKVLHDAVLLKKETKTMTKGGIILSDKAVESAPTFVGIVQQIGNGEEIAKCELRLGDRVLVYANIRGGFPKMPNQDDMIIAPCDALLGILEAGD